MALSISGRSLLLLLSWALQEFLQANRHSFAAGGGLPPCVLTGRMGGAHISQNPAFVVAGGRTIAT